MFRLFTIVNDPFWIWEKGFMEEDGASIYPWHKNPLLMWGKKGGCGRGRRRTIDKDPLFWWEKKGGVYGGKGVYLIGGGRLDLICRILDSRFFPSIHFSCIRWSFSRLSPTNLTSSRQDGVQPAPLARETTTQERGRIGVNAPVINANTLIILALRYNEILRECECLWERERSRDRERERECEEKWEWERMRYS